MLEMRCCKSDVVITGSPLCEILGSCCGADEDCSLGDRMPCGLIHRYKCTEEHTSIICRVVQEGSKERIYFRIKIYLLLIFLANIW
jgi:hypothetical protein